MENPQTDPTTYKNKTHSNGGISNHWSKIVTCNKFWSLIQKVKLNDYLWGEGRGERESIPCIREKNKLQMD